MDEEDGFRQSVLDSPWLVAVLRAVRTSSLPDAWVGAGVLRDLVWDGRLA